MPNFQFGNVSSQLRCQATRPPGRLCDAERRCAVSFPAWYVVQVSPGQEDKTCALVELAARDRLKDGRPVLEECFTPRYQVERKYHGAWRMLQPNLFPGYVIAVTRHVVTLNECLRAVPSFTRILGSEAAFVPLDPTEKSFIDTFTTCKHRVIELSRAVVAQEGDRVVVTEGPLVGREGWITKINRRKSTARIETSMFGRTLNVEVGLAVLNKAPGEKPAG